MICLLAVQEFPEGKASPELPHEHVATVHLSQRITLSQVGGWETASPHKMRSVAAVRAIRVRENRQLTSFASMVIVAFNTLDTGQPSFAFFAALSKASFVAFGTFAVTSRCTAVMENPASPLSSVDSRSRIDALGSQAGSFELAGKRHGEASSMGCANQLLQGLVPLPSSKRVLKEYCVAERTPLSVEIVPRPLFKPPFQTADALRFMVSSSVF